MPDVLIDDANATNNARCFSRYVVGIDQNIHYVFYVSAFVDLFFSRSIDGGATWSAPTTIHSGNVMKFQVWYDRWTPGDTGTVIHIILVDSVDRLSYYSLNTDGDILGAELVIDSPVVSSTVLYVVEQVTIAKSCGGNLLVQYWGDAAGSHGCWRSVDGGASWVERTDGADGNDVDFVMMFPGNEDDDNDFWMVYLDTSANELSLKTYDDSADSWSEAVIIAGISESAVFWQYAAAIRHSDKHLILATWTDIDDVAADILTFDINGGASIVAMADVVTNLAESGNTCLTINQQNDDVYVGYNKGGVWAATVDSVYKVSTDGMVTWGAEQPMSENAADDYRALSSTLSIDDDGGKFLPVWFNDDLDDMFCNVNNSVSINPIVPPLDPGLPEYGQRRAAIGDPPVYGATIVRS